MLRYSDGTVKGNCVSAYTKFNTNPIDSTVKVFKVPLDEMPAPRQSGYTPKPKGVSFATGMPKVRKNEPSKKERKTILRDAIDNGKVTTLEEAVSYMELSRQTIKKYLSEMKIRLAN